MIVALSAAHDGKESNQALSIHYLMYKWRRIMHVSPREAAVTPIDVILRDLEYIGIERTISAAKAKST